MKILGKYNWYLPKWLEWIPNISLGELPVKAKVQEAAGSLPGKSPISVQEEE